MAPFPSHQSDDTDEICAWNKDHVTCHVLLMSLLILIFVHHFRTGWYWPWFTIVVIHSTFTAVWPGKRSSPSTSALCSLSTNSWTSPYNQATHPTPSQPISQQPFPGVKGISYAPGCGCPTPGMFCLGCCTWRVSFKSWRSSITDESEIHTRKTKTNSGI